MDEDDFIFLEDEDLDLFLEEFFLDEDPLDDYDSMDELYED